MQLDMIIAGGDVYTPERIISGMVEAGLVCDDLTTEVIADGRHLPTSLLRLAYKCKGAGRLCLISDAMRASGLPEGSMKCAKCRPW
jgi:N-acetylglucosamine-6-phosphate deacetylase